MRITRTLAAAVLLPLAAACSDAGVTEPAAAAPAEPSAVLGVAPVCVTFGPMPPAGTMWGIAAGHFAGDPVHMENSILVRVDWLFLPGGGALFNNSILEPAAAVGWGSLNVLRMQGISTRYHFMASGGWVPNHVRFQYQDLGGVENLEINGALFVGNIAGAPAVLGGANVVVGPNWVDITGPVNNLLIGGEDFRVDNMCTAP